MRRGELACRLLDIAVVGFAVWTVLYHLALALDLPTTALLIAWLIASAGVVVLGARSSWMGAAVPAAGAGRSAEGAKPSAEGGTPGGTGKRYRWRVLPMWCAVLAGAAAAGAVANGAWLPGLALAAVAIACTALAAPWRSPGPDAAHPEQDPQPGDGIERPPVPVWAELVAVLVAAGFAVFSQFIVRPDGDDSFYVNRSVWVAEHGRIPIGDVLFGEDRGVMPGAAPISAVEALAGALARVLHVDAAAFVYYVLLPAATFLAVLALWRLIRAWAPRRAVLCLLLAAAFLLYAGGSAASFGSFHLVRAWQGKAIFVSLMVPVLYAYLGEWFRTRRRRFYLLALAAGVAGVGLTSSATFVVPLVVAAVGLGLLVRYGLSRRSPYHLVLVGLVAVYPVAAALAVAVFVGAPGGDNPIFVPAKDAWGWVIGPGPLTVLGGAALWLGPLLVRRGVAAAMAWGTSAVALVLMIPGVLEALADASGSGPVLWRALWLAPVPALVGLLAAVRIPRPSRVRVPERAVGWVPAMAGVLVLVQAGTPVWADTNRARLDSPQWKANMTTVSKAFAIVRAYPEAKVVLAPPAVMASIPLVTSRVKSVNPRTAYTRSLTDGTSGARLLLSNLSGNGRPPATAKVRDALESVDVDVACLHRSNEPGLRKLREAGFGDEREVAEDLMCLTSGADRAVTTR